MVTRTRYEINTFDFSGKLTKENESYCGDWVATVNFIRDNVAIGETENEAIAIIICKLRKSLSSRDNDKLELENKRIAKIFNEGAPSNQNYEEVQKVLSEHFPEFVYSKSEK